MFTIRKLEALPAGTRRRKIERLLHAAEVDLAGGVQVDRGHLAAVVGLLVADRGMSAASRERMRELASGLDSADPAIALRSVNSLRSRLLLELGAEPSEWDFVVSGAASLDRAARTVFPFRVYLEDIRSPFNVGSIFRTAECFGVRELLLSPDTPLPSHPRAAKTARGTVELLEWRVSGLEAVRTDAVFALELGGEPVDRFDFPEAGTVIVGSEELGVSPEALAIAGRSRGRVSIPLFGAKQSLNVSVAFGILMSYWVTRVASRFSP